MKSLDTLEVAVEARIVAWRVEAGSHYAPCAGMNKRDALAVAVAAAGEPGAPVELPPRRLWTVRRNHRMDWWARCERSPRCLGWFVELDLVAKE